MISTGTLEFVAQQSTSCTNGYERLYVYLLDDFDTLRCLIGIHNTSSFVLSKIANRHLLKTFQGSFLVSPLFLMVRQSHYGDLIINWHSPCMKPHSLKRVTCVTNTSLPEFRCCFRCVQVAML